MLQRLEQLGTLGDDRGSCGREVTTANLRSGVARGSEVTAAKEEPVSVCCLRVVQVRDAKVDVGGRAAVGVVSDGQQTNVPRCDTVSPNEVAVDSDSESD